MGLAQELRQHSHAEIIFITAYDQYAVDAFDVESADYVLKPVSKERLVTALERARKRLIARSLERTLDYAGPGWHSPQTTAPNPPQDEPVYWAQTSQGQIRVAISAVIRIEACKDYDYLHLPNRQTMIRETMASLEEQFSAHGFLRVHRSHIINVDRVERLSHDGRKRFVHLDEGSYVPLGQSYRERLEASLNSTSLLPPKTGTDQL